MPRFSVNQVTTKRWSLEEDAFNYSKVGTAGIGLWRDKISDYGEEKARDLLTELDLNVSSYSYVGGFTGCQGRWRDRVKDAVETMASARSLGARNVLLFSGSRNGHIRPQAMRCLLDAIEKLLPFAEEFGIRLLLQPMLEKVSKRWNFLYDWDSVFRVLDRYPHQLVGFVLNTYHATFLNEIWSELPGRMDQLGLVQLSDGCVFPSQSRRREDCALGDGIMLPDVRLNEILNLGYDGWVEVESAGQAILKAGYRRVLESNHGFLQSVMQARQAGVLNASNLASKSA